MRAQLWHLTLASTTRHALFPEEQLRRWALRKMIHVTERELCLYSLVDDHLHLVLLCSRARAAVLQRAIKLTLRPLMIGASKFDCRPVEGRSHLKWLLRYFLTQSVKHGLKDHPALWPGSCFQDLVGARCGVDLRTRLDDLLPRLPRHAASELVGLPRRALQPASDELIRRLGGARLAVAAASALLVGPRLTGSAQPMMQAKRAVAQLASSAGLQPRDLRRVCREDSRTIRRWQRPAVDGAVLHAVRMRLALEELVGQRAAPNSAARSSGSRLL